MNLSAATKSDIPELAKLLGEVFAEDPAMSKYVARSRDPQRSLTRLFEVLLHWYYLPCAVVDVARDEAGHLLGTALWTPPGVDLSKRRALRMLPRIVLALGASSFEAWRLYWKDSAMEPRFDHWYLFVIAASPAARGKGVGGALLDRGIDRAGDEAIYLESTGDRSRALYQRKGFMPLGSVGIEVGMWRPGLVT